MSHLHPSISERDTSQDIDVASLMVMADVIISDYSSLPIEASLLNKPTLFYITMMRKTMKSKRFKSFLL